MKVFDRTKKKDVIRILVTNDDGIDSLGMRCLVKALSEVPGTEVYVSTPAVQQSGMSHSIVIQKKLLVREVEVPGAVRAMTIESTPADACLFGLDILAAEGIGIDVVYSGVNHGYNTAEDVPYSGTVGAAAEGAMDGIPSVAVSTSLYPEKGREYTPADFESACRAAVQILPTALEADTDYLMNINAPNCPPSEVKGWKVTTLGHIKYDMHLTGEPAEGGGTYYYYKVNGMALSTEEELPGTDTAALADGYVSLTLVRTDYTNHRDMERYRAIVKDWKL